MPSCACVAGPPSPLNPPGPVPATGETVFVCASAFAATARSAHAVPATMTWRARPIDRTYVYPQVRSIADVTALAVAVGVAADHDRGLLAVGVGREVHDLVDLEVPGTAAAHDVERGLAGELAGAGREVDVLEVVAGL